MKSTPGCGCREPPEGRERAAPTTQQRRRAYPVRQYSAQIKIQNTNTNTKCKYITQIQKKYKTQTQNTNTNHAAHILLENTVKLTDQDTKHPVRRYSAQIKIQICTNTKHKTQIQKTSYISCETIHSSHRSRYKTEDMKISC